jgi:hypothetical protein
MISSMMHFYLFAKCKTPGCVGKLYIAHTERPDNTTFIDYPDEWFPVQVPCGLCSQTHSYSLKEIQTEISPIPTHPPGWKPIFPDPPPDPKDIN